ncbi:MAG: phenylacetate--CoA ligase family protein [Flavobacteriaceae bacterium]
MIFKLFIILSIKLGDFFFKYSIYRNIKKWSDINKMSKDELNELQRKNFTKFLNNSIKRVPFYKELNVKMEGDPYVDIKKFPIMTKSSLRKNEDDLISKDFDKNNLLASYSSGSSGIQSRVFMSKPERSSNWGILLNIWKLQGYEFGNPIIQTGITPDRSKLKFLKDFLFRTSYVNAFSHSETELKKILLKNKNNKNTVIIGYASSLNVMAEIVLKEQLKIKVKSVISFGDKLFDKYKKNINKAFNTDVKESYGSNEGLMIAFQKDLDYLYIINPHVYVEILDDHNNPVLDGEMGNIVVTRLDCFSMPLIRYKIGDLGIKLPLDEYPKKRKYNYPLLKQVVGRETDIIVLPNKTKMVVHSFTGIFEYIPEIKQFKVIQEDLKGITIEYIKSDTFSESTLKKVLTELRKYINTNEFNITFKEVNYIAPTKSGKPQIIESRLKK